MEKNAITGMTRSPDTRKQKRHHRHVLALALTLALLPHAVLIGLFVRDWIYESGKSSYETVDRPIDGFSLNAAALDEYFRAAYPEVCQGMDLTGVEMNVYVQDATIVGGTMELDYFRYIDESREGGNVASAVFAVDPATGCLKEIEQYRGAGKGCTEAMEPMSDKTAGFPLSWYVENLPALTQTDSGRPLRMLCYSGLDVVTVNVFDDAERTEPLYGESMTDWSEAAGFDGRTFERTD